MTNRLITYIGTKAKCRHLKKFTSKGTGDTVQSVMLVFSTVRYTILYTRIQCVRGGGAWGSGP